ncbi:glycerol-3-phosphate 1-O-acyltransferase PlsY [Geminicoccaceae bacterium 1502E]|nr:glycerol-3-phosphate 1-O-acyltransferase PlsY [Geminicoccaceae bacterium 1502E]
MVEPGMTDAGGLPLLLAFLAGYLAGSVPFGLVFTRLAGAGDVRRIGSGNIGATNVLRTGRKGLAAATLLADILKGALPVLAARFLLGEEAAALAGAGAVLGHCFPVWLRFKGGKGVATAAGIMLGFAPLVLPFVLALFIAVVWFSRFVSLGSIVAALAAPLAAWLLGYPLGVWLFAVVALVIIVQHRENLGRLLAGRENRITLGSR